MSEAVLDAFRDGRGAPDKPRLTVFDPDCIEEGDATGDHGVGEDTIVAVAGGDAEACATGSGHGDQRVDSAL